MPAELLTPQEVTLVQNTIATQRRVYQEYVTITKHLRRQRALRLDTRTPRSFQKIIGKGVRAPLSFSIVQTIVGLIAKGQPYFTRVPLTSAKKDDAARLAATCWPLIQTYSHMAHKDLYYLMTDQLAGDGKGVVKLNRKTLTDYPAEKDYTEDGKFNSSGYNEACRIYLSQDGHNPLRISLIDPTTFWPSRELDQSYVVESGNRPLVPTLKALGLKLGVNNTFVEVPAGDSFSDEMVPSGLSPYEQINEVWTDDWCYIEIGGKLLKFRNDLGFIPYSWRNGMATSMPDPAMEAMSVVFPFYDLEPHVNTLLTSMLSHAVLTGMPVAQIETAPNSGQSQEPAPTDIPLGQMMHLGPGKKFSWATPPAMSEAVVQVANLMFSMYERAGITTAARGIIGTRTPGLTFTSALEAAGDMVMPVKAGLEGLCEDIVKMTWRASEALKMPIHVTGDSLIEGTGRKQLSIYHITPRLIGKYYDIHCEVKPTSTQDMTTKGMHAAFMNQHGMWSWERSAAYAGVDNPTAERLELLKDKIRNSPVYLETAMRAALQDDPEGQQIAAEFEAQGLSPFVEGEVVEPTGQEGSPEEGLPGGQIRGATPRGGGRTAGAARRPTGPRPPTPGQQFPA